jgi:hypothetical protein
MKNIWKGLIGLFVLLLGFALWIAGSIFEGIVGAFGESYLLTRAAMGIGFLLIFLGPIIFWIVLPLKDRWYEKHRKRFAIVLIPIVLFVLLIFSAIVPIIMVGPLSKEQKGEIESLAYIKIMASGYTDDADPEHDGVAIDISYYDNKSEIIDFKNIPLNVTIQFYGYHSVAETSDHDKMILVYEKAVTVEHSMRLNEMFGKYIRISFDEISVDSNKYYKYGTVKVTVNFKQKEFSDDADLVPLYVEGGEKIE